MNSSPEDFQDLRRLLALKRHEKPPPGYFNYLPDKILIRVEQDDLSEYSGWWQWLVNKIDAQPVLAGAYAFAISGLMLLGFKLSQDLQYEAASNEGGLFGNTIDPSTLHPASSIQRHFANPAPLLYLDVTSTEPVVDDPPAVTSYRTFPVRTAFTLSGH